MLDAFIANHFGFDEFDSNEMKMHDVLSNVNFPLERVSQDKKLNITGKMLLDMCKNNNMLIVNVRDGSDTLENDLYCLCTF